MRGVLAVWLVVTVVAVVMLERARRRRAAVGTAAARYRIRAGRWTPGPNAPANDVAHQLRVDAGYQQAHPIDPRAVAPYVERERFNSAYVGNRGPWLP